MFENLTSSFRAIASKIRFNDDEKALSRALDELKKTLLKNDIHHKSVKEILTLVEAKTKASGIGKSQFLSALEAALGQILQASKAYGFSFSPTPPTITLMCGLQGSGKTTTSAKLANYLKSRGKKVLLVACDLARMAAVTQLEQLGAQIEVEVFSPKNLGAVTSGVDFNVGANLGADSANLRADSSADSNAGASLSMESRVDSNAGENTDSTPLQIAKSAVAYATKNAFDVVILDTAGRLSIDERLMAELKDIKAATRPTQSIYVADALSGQEGVRNAANFDAAIGVDGVILSKFDSDSKGGVALSIAHQIGLPLLFLGNGEKVADFEIFLPERIISRLLGAGDIAGLAEKTAAVLSEKDAKDVAKKIKKGSFGLEDFLAQVENIKKLGNLGSLASMIPGLGGMASQLKNVDLDNSAEVKTIRAMVNSMTKKERQNPDILNGSRRLRIARGAGIEVSDINRVLKQFELAAKMAKKVSSKGGMSELMSLLSQPRR